MHHKKSAALEAATTPEQKLDLIATYLERMDRRDKWRLWGGYVHSLLTLIPMLFFIWSTWYLYAHFDEIMGSMMRQAGANAAVSTGQSYEDVMRQIREAFGMGSSSAGQ